MVDVRDEVRDQGVSTLLEILRGYHGDWPERRLWVSTLLEILLGLFRTARQRDAGAEVSTLLEILQLRRRLEEARGGVVAFQPFLRFYGASLLRRWRDQGRGFVSTLLEILLVVENVRTEARLFVPFQPFLRFYIDDRGVQNGVESDCGFNPS